MKLKSKHIINLHKFLTAPFIFTLMLLYNNFTTVAGVYLVLHGTYGILWLFKDRIYPDQQWEKEISISFAIFLFAILGLYWVAPFIIVGQNSEPLLFVMLIAIAIYIFGIFFHFASDAQKYYTLKYQKGLISEGFFASCRNTNYLGEIFIYSGFAMLAMHWLPFMILGGYVVGIFIPNMIKKDKSLSRYSDFEKYKKNSGFLWPKFSFFNHKSTEADTEIAYEE